MSKVWISAPNSIKSKGGWGCDCMKQTLPLIEADMEARGLIRQAIDTYQFGYNGTNVSASAGTHAAGGVIDVIQGITLAERKIWAKWGVMMFPRTSQWGYPTSAMSPPHGHGVWHGCPHQTASADKQVRDGIAGRDGLVSNRRRNFEAPTRTWQEAVRANRTPAPKPTPKPAPKEDDDMPRVVVERKSTMKKTLPVNKFSILPLGNTTDPNHSLAYPFEPRSVAPVDFTVSARINLAPVKRDHPLIVWTRWVCWLPEFNRWHRWPAKGHENVWEIADDFSCTVSQKHGRLALDVKVNQAVEVHETYSSVLLWHK